MNFEQAQKLKQGDHVRYNWVDTDVPEWTKRDGEVFTVVEGVQNPGESVECASDDDTWFLEYSQLTFVDSLFERGMRELKRQ